MTEQRNCYRFILLPVAVVLLSTSLVLGACAKQTPEPIPISITAPNPEPEPSLPLEWSADGIITAGEYTDVATYDSYEIHWASDKEYVYIGMKAKTIGWVTVGIKPTSGMKDADMIFGFVKDGKPDISDQFSTGTYGPHYPDSELGGTDDISDFGGKEEDGYTTIEFKRALKTGDKYDNELAKEVNKIIWAYGSNDDLKSKHTSRGHGEIILE